MSRRHHGRSRHPAARRPRHDAATGQQPAPGAPPVASDGGPAAVAAVRPEPLDGRPATDGPPTSQPERAVNDAPTSPAPRHGPNGSNGGPPGNNGCTAPQLRRFIKSRPYVPMHELRRRFGIDGGDDDVTQVRLDAGAIYVGLPAREGGLLGELLRGGEIGYELSLDPRTPIVVGVYPMRPIPRA
jgi:hypothetical protein